MSYFVVCFLSLDCVCVWPHNNKNFFPFSFIRLKKQKTKKINFFIQKIYRQFSLFLFISVHFFNKKETQNGDKIKNLQKKKNKQ